MAEHTLTVTQTQQSTSENSPILRLRLKKPKSRKKVKWTNDTVDNEGLNKKKSKCCCVYQKPRVFGESSSEDDSDECESCSGHKPNCYKQADNPESKTISHGPSGSDGSGGGPSDENPNSPSGSSSNEGGAVGGTFT